MSKKRNITTITDQSTKYLSEILDKEDVNDFKKLLPELKNSWAKKQIFRTETEMRFSVLSDNKYPTKAAKYWQSVREQTSHFNSLVGLSFDYRKNEIEIKKIEKKLKQEKDDLEREILLIELDRFLFYKADMELTAKDRMREISTWSKIKQELNDGSFDDENVNTHQAESYRLKLQEEAKHIQGLTHPSEISNVLGQLSTLDRIVREGQLLNQKKENKKLKK